MRTLIDRGMSLRMKASLSLLGLSLAKADIVRFSRSIQGQSEIHELDTLAVLLNVLVMFYVISVLGCIVAVICKCDRDRDLYVRVSSTRKVRKYNPPPPPQPDNKASCDEKACIVCMENERVMMARPCNHLILCLACAAKQKIGRCVLCRNDIEELERIYP